MERPPAFDDPTALFVDGLEAFAVAFVYGIVPVAIAFAVFVPVSVVGVAGGADPGRAAAGVGVLALLDLAVAALLFTFGLALLVLVPLGAFVNFWVYLVTVHFFGTAYREAMGAEPAGG